MKHFSALLISLCLAGATYGQNESFLFRTPLSFYNTDILSYLQALHKNQQYEKMVPFFTGPLTEEQSSEELVELLSNAPFGYNMKRSGIREVEAKRRWSLTFARTILGTQETFKIDCELISDTCRVVLNANSFTTIFK